jgi:hypothetical protein
LAADDAGERTPAGEQSHCRDAGLIVIAAVRERQRIGL